jgi:hypothetical protein
LSATRYAASRAIIAITSVVIPIELPLSTYRFTRIALQVNIGAIVGLAGTCIYQHFPPHLHLANRHRRSTLRAKESYVVGVIHADLYPVDPVDFPGAFIE